MFGCMFSHRAYHIIKYNIPNERLLGHAALLHEACWCSIASKSGMKAFVSWCCSMLLKGQCVGMEAIQSPWFHWQWNHDETKGLRGFTVHVVDNRRYMQSTWKTTKVYRRMEQWKQMYLCFNEAFVVQRKLRVDPSETVWYAVEQYSERTQQNVGTGVENGPFTGMHS